MVPTSGIHYHQGCLAKVIGSVIVNIGDLCNKHFFFYLENLSRRIVQYTALLVLVSDASNAGLNTLLRLYELAAEMKLTYGKLVLVINKLRVNEDGLAKLPGRITEIREKTKADIALGLGDDPEIASLSENSGCLLGISETNPVYKVISGLIKNI